MTIQKFFAAKTEPVGDRQARVICSTGDIDRAGDIVVQDGIDLSAYRNNPIVLWGHDTGQPIARASEIGVVDGKLMATVEFPPVGVSAKADEICGLVKSGVVSAVSIGMKHKTRSTCWLKRQNGIVSIQKAQLLKFTKRFYILAFLHVYIYTPGIASRLRIKSAVLFPSDTLLGRKT